MLFNLITEEPIIKTEEHDKRVTVNGDEVHRVRFADDISRKWATAATRNMNKRKNLERNQFRNK